MGEGLELKVKEHERRITKLENHRETDYEKINSINTELATIVVELKNVTRSIEDMTNNMREAINQNNDMQKIEHDNINSRISTLETNVTELNDKFGLKQASLEKELSNQTIGKNSEKWEKAKWIVVSVIITAIVSYAIAKIFP
jgi:chromosome segregation ATPase